MDARIPPILASIRERCMAVFTTSLTGVYLHGSLAFGCFHWPTSDIDFIVVVKTPPSLEQKVKLLESFASLLPHCPPKGIEMSVVLEDTCTHFHHPAPFELHFSNHHRQRCLEDIPSFCRWMKGEDPDLAAHYTVIREVGIPLYGKPISQVFAPVPPSDFLNSIGLDLEETLRDIPDFPLYYICNLCRILAYLQEGAVLSKEQGCLWACDRLPCSYRPLVREALGRYRDGAPFSPAFSKELLVDFARYMGQQISQAGLPLPV